MIDYLERLGAQTLSRLQTLGQSGLFLSRIIWQKPNMLRVWPMLSEQLYFVGVLSFLIMIVSGVFIGMVVGLQGYHTLQKFGAVSHVGQLLALSITRELGPVLTALLFAGRAGSALTAEIGLMKATEQLASMDMMGIDPMRRIIYPRFWAGMIALPLLDLIFSMVAIYGGYWVAVQIQVHRLLSGLKIGMHLTPSASSILQTYGHIDSIVFSCVTNLQS